ncbi:MAG: flagellar basal body L-ring protein FlgH [Alphaproteobacteria bacterium]|nr:flagellar basal body L-ring protein FlgH [Alphaproteobacteria bacterium]
MSLPAPSASPERSACTCWKSGLRLGAIVLLLLGQGACAQIGQIKDVGRTPDLAPIENPVATPAYRPVTMPMPDPDVTPGQANSLWRVGARAFFKDQRAARVGDILTVEIDITDQAQVNNTTSRSRTSAADADLTNLLGLETQLTGPFAEGIDPSSLASFGNTTSANGTGTINRSESVSLTVAAIVTQILPNGNLVIMGRQEVRVNYEVRELLITGLVRPEDITNQNTVQHTQIAEARISYGGRGHISQVQQPAWGQQVYDILFPF